MNSTAARLAGMPGVARRLLTFFASPKKGPSTARTKKKGDRGMLAFGFPSTRMPKWEMKRTRLRLRHVSFLIHFDLHVDGSIQADFFGAD
jgi:hypothetical protein